ncbi:hypothetical protein C8T65DRAFT_204299 [Cerioporus squamosus]|nr:hypothetical protein C8T65DRAFT_204299 [Cerioporus squamosus]
MPSAEIVAVIQDIKYNVEKPHLCGWLDRLESNQSKRVRTERYIDGAVKIVDLLRNELPLADIREYERRYQQFISLPGTWFDERLHCARELWDFVVAIDELLSVSRISSAYDQRSEWDSDSETCYSVSPESSPKCREASSQRPVQFVNTPEVHPWTPSSYVQSAATPTTNSWWWPSSNSWYSAPYTTSTWVPSIFPSLHSGWYMSYAPVTCVASEGWPPIYGRHRFAHASSYDRTIVTTLRSLAIDRLTDFFVYTHTQLATCTSVFLF